MSDLVLSDKGLMPSNLSEAMQLSEILSKSTIVPKDYINNPGNILVAIQWGAEIGLAHMQAMQNIAVINGRPSIWGDAMLALVRKSPTFEKIKEEIIGEGDDRVAICTVKRKGEDEHTVEFSVEDAKKAGLWTKQGPWQQYPKRMLQMRARGYALRDVFTDVLKGMDMAEEVRDIPEEKDMGEVEQVESARDKVLNRLKNKTTEQAPKELECSPAELLILKIESTESKEQLKTLDEEVVSFKEHEARPEVEAAYKAALVRFKTEDAEIVE